MSRGLLLTARPNAGGMMGNYQCWTGEKRPPNGLGYLKAVLDKAGHECEIVDRYAGQLENPLTLFPDPDLIGIYCCSVCTDDIKELLERFDGHKIAVGGPHAFLYPEWFPDNVTVVRGEGEDAILRLTEIADARWWGPARMLDTPRITDLDSLPRFPWEYFWNLDRRNLYSWDFQHDLSYYPVFTMNTTRGCPYACSFCQTRTIWGSKITAFSAHRVLEDVDYCVKLGAKAIYFREDNFTVLQSRLREICAGLKGREIPWFCETRADIDLDLLPMMAGAGCRWVYVGVESLSQRMLDIYNKKLEYETIMDFFGHCRKAGIKTYASFITNHPEETAADRALTAFRMRKLMPDAHYFNQWRET